MRRAFLTPQDFRFAFSHEPLKGGNVLPIPNADPLGRKLSCLHGKALKIASRNQSADSEQLRKVIDQIKSIYPDGPGGTQDSNGFHECSSLT
jgi:hypothetical protein